MSSKKRKSVVVVVPEEVPNEPIEEPLEKEPVFEEPSPDQVIEPSSSLVKKKKKSKAAPEMKIEPKMINKEDVKPPISAHGTIDNKPFSLIFENATYSQVSLNITSSTIFIQLKL